MPGHFLPVAVDGAAVSDAAKPHNDAVVLPCSRDKETGSIPEITAIIAAGLVGEQVGKAGRHRDAQRVRQAVGPPCGSALGLWVEPEIPHAIQAAYLTGRSAAGIKQRNVQHNSENLLNNKKPRRQALARAAERGEMKKIRDQSFAAMVSL